MINRKKAAIIGLILLGISVGISLFLYNRVNNHFIGNKNAIYKGNSYLKLIVGSKKLKDIWSEGSVDSFPGNPFEDCDFELPGINSKNTDSSFFECNPNFIQCLFRRRAIGGDPHLTINFKGEKTNLFAKRLSGDNYYSIITKSNFEGLMAPNYAVMFELYIKGQEESSLKFMFENSCGEQFLPQRVYSISPFEEKDWRWDNFNRSIFIDRYLVRNRDVLEWIESDSSVKLGRDRFYKDSSMPATGLSFSDMKNYCAFRGKNLMTAHFFDAATFHPGEIANKGTDYFPRAPYPWSRKKKSKTILEAIENRDAESFDESCKKIYSKECKNIKWPSSNYSSWMGIQQVLGGAMEIMNNRLNIKNNLMVSSMLLPISSKWHQLGKRANWNGINFSMNSFDFFGDGFSKESSSNLVMGFRCMRQLVNEI